MRRGKRLGDLKGALVADGLYLSHLIFVDDVLIFRNGSRHDYLDIKEIISLLSKATGMEVN